MSSWTVSTPNTVDECVCPENPRTTIVQSMAWASVKVKQIRRQPRGSDLGPYEGPILEQRVRRLRGAKNKPSCRNISASLVTDRERTRVTISRQAVCSPCAHRSSARSRSQRVVRRALGSQVVCFWPWAFSMRRCLHVHVVAPARRLNRPQEERSCHHGFATGDSVAAVAPSSRNFLTSKL